MSQLNCSLAFGTRRCHQSKKLKFSLYVRLTIKNFINQQPLESVLCVYIILFIQQTILFNVDYDVVVQFYVLQIKMLPFFYLLNSHSLSRGIHGGTIERFLCTYIK